QESMIYIYIYIYFKTKVSHPQTYQAYCPQYVIRKQNNKKIKIKIKIKKIKDEKTPSKLVVVKY
ncbi:MAG: hypothetical protein O4M80_05845, partial [Buchnera aphidicola]|nr:hypothetical protein [Buchnera aphidicola]